MTSITQRYTTDGIVWPVDIMDSEESAQHRQRLEQAESMAGPLHYKVKMHTLLTSPWELATHPTVLDTVEQMIGPDILLYNTVYIIKEPQTESFVSWHQDLTYWGFDQDDLVSMWLALSPATTASGCMQVIPGSHTKGKFKHEVTEDPGNLLYSGQTVFGVDDSAAVSCELKPGQASFHHGWLLHNSGPNRSDDRRIGLNVQYLAPHLRQTKHDGDSAILVRGEDRYRHFEYDMPAEEDLTPEGIDQQAILEQR